MLQENAVPFISGLFVYPIKSCKGISLQKAIIEERGIQHDRRWMLVDEHNTFITQRTTPRMALIEVTVKENGLRVTAPQMESLSIPFLQTEGSPFNTIIWDDTVSAIRVSNEADEWFSTFLQLPCRLVHQPEESIRQVDTRYTKKFEHTGFADAFPILVISDSSLDELNKRLDIPVPMNRFRPNITIGGSTPFAEDVWKTIKTNSILFHLVKPCARCVITTTNQITGVRGNEPLHTMSKFRMVNNKVLFGQNTVADSHGEILVNEKVEILK